MRNHIAIISEESVFAGHYQCGIGEVVDCMASALRKYYDVTIVTIGMRKGGRKGGTITLGVEGEAFYAAAAEVVNDLQPDLVHNFARPDLIDLLTVECPKVLSFDQWEEDMEVYHSYAAKYDHVTTMSAAYADEMIAAHPEAAVWPLVGITNGIDGTLYSTGAVLMGGKQASRAKLYRGIGKTDTGKKLIVNMGRLIEIKGMDQLISEAEDICAAGADLVIWGTGDAEYEEKLTALHEAGVLTYYRRMCDYFEMVSAMRAADFYLMPSTTEVCGLQPMKAARMGCVPIVTEAGGLGENFGDTNAILIYDSIADAVRRAAALSDEEYASLRQNCIDGDWTWDTRILPWVELYGLPTAPKETPAVQAYVKPVSKPAETAATFGAPVAEEPEAVVYPCPFAKKEGANG